MKHIEDDHQKMLIQWAKITRIESREGVKIGDFMFAIPNGGKRGVREAARMKAQGVKAGVSDLFFSFPSGGKHGLYIELKRPIEKGKAKPRLTEAQTDWIEKARSVGYAAEVCFGFEEAKKAIEQYI